MKKRFYLVLSILLLFQLFLTQKAVASHVFGGDIVYRCLGNNNYEFTFTLYQDCLMGDPGAIQADNPSFYSIFNDSSGAYITGGSTGLFVSQNFIPTGFSNDCINNMPNTCMQKTVFRFNVTLPPNNNGYRFVYQRCCRNQTINNIYSPGTTGATFTTRIPPFTNNQCSNNSAVFNYDPPQIICVNNPLTVDFSATDMDGDSLSYELCNAYIGGDVNNAIPGAPGYGPIQAPPYTPVSYIPPFNATNPIPSVPGFYIDPVTGILNGHPNTVGRYVISICVKEWRNGVVVNTSSRDLQFVITDCSKAVIADLPSFSFEPDVYIARCDSTFLIHFENISSGGFSYFWDFGDPTTDADTSSLETPSWTYPDTGTYYVKLVVNRGSTCPDSTIRKVKIYPKFEVDFDIVGKLCKGEPIQFNDRSVATFPEIYDWQWQFGSEGTSGQQNPVHVFSTNTEEYWIQLIAKTTKGCIDTAIKKITIPHFIPFAGNDTFVIKGHTFNMNGSGGAFYQWTPTEYLTNANDPKSSITLPEIGVYRYNLHVTSEHSCEGNDSVRITVAEHPYFVVPSAFSPNGDGRNDVIRPLTAGYNLRFFRIYNRWGQIVHQMYNGSTGGWDGTLNGKLAETGVYFWHAQATNLEGKDEEFKGDITLIR